MVSVLLALAAAFADALNVVTQHYASTAAPREDRGWKLALYLVRSPLWLFGVGAMVASFGFQAFALYEGRISVVQSLLVTTLVFALLIGRVWLHRDVTPAAWASASVTAAGLVVFLIMSEPQGGHPEATSGAVLPALATCGGLVALLTILAGSGSPVRRAALYASASGITFALLATFMKATTDELGTDGLVVTLERGAVYGLIVAGIVGAVLTQAALHHGPLGVSQPLMLIVNPVFSILLGVWVFGEHFVGGAWKVALGALGFAIMVAGVVALA